MHLMQIKYRHFTYRLCKLWLIFKRKILIPESLNAYLTNLGIKMATSNFCYNDSFQQIVAEQEEKKCLLSISQLTMLIPIQE